jgi:addiction module RelE/StbE family toxin
MPNLIRSTEFKKEFKRLSEKLKRKTIERLQVFVLNEFEASLNNHPLHGEYAGCRSINVTGNFRLIYCRIDSGNYLLVEVGTHHQLYE